MPNNADLEDELEAITDDFDPIPFVDQLMTSIKAMRSNNAPKPQEFFDGPVDVDAGKEGESKLNTFFRILGFPATRDEEKLNEGNSTLKNFKELLESNVGTDLELSVKITNERNRLLSQDDTLNYFNPAEIIFDGLSGPNGEAFTSTSLSQNLSARERQLTEKIKQDKFSNMLQSPLKINSSISSTTAGDRRVQLFPLVVNADIPIYPQKRRVAPFFYSGDFIVNRTRLSRPFIEHIIHARTKSFAGLNSPIKSFLITNITNEVLNAGDADSTREQIIASLDNFPALELQLIQKFIKTLKISAKSYVNIRQLAAKLKTKIDFVPKGKSEPNEKVGEDTSLSIAEKQKIISPNAETGQESFVATNKVLDIKIGRIKEEINRLDQFLQIMPTESLKKSDAIRRLGDNATSNNLVPDIFVSEFTSLASFERESLEDVLAVAKGQRAKIIQEYEDVKKAIMYYSGEFVGLSIFDIICVLAALFTVETKYLIGLLNQGSQNRLISNSLYYTVSTGSQTGLTRTSSVDDIADGASQVTVSAALIAVQEKVKLYFDLVDSFVKDFESKNENKAV